MGGRKVWTYYKSAADKKILFTREFGGAVVFLISRDDPDKIRGTQATAIFHDEIGMDK